MYFNGLALFLAGGRNQQFWKKNSSVLQKTFFSKVFSDKIFPRLSIIGVGRGRRNPLAPPPDETKRCSPYFRRL